MEKTLSDIFEEHFNEKPLIIRSPGRINIIGEHTDYNDGFVLPAAIDRAAYLAISIRNDDEIHLIAKDLNEKFTVNLNDLKPVGDVSWPNFLLGAAAQLLNLGIKIRGFNAILSSDVPIGAGLSSSAAIECATVFALNELFNIGLSKIEMIKIAQKAEHEYAGVMCGIMDQFASMMGKKDHVIRLDCKSLDFQYVPFKLDGYKIVLLDTNVKHSLASSEYNLRRQECNFAVELIKANIPSVCSLRDANKEDLDLYVKPFSEKSYMRGKFIIDEIKRLNDGCQDLINGDFNELGRKMFSTHQGLSKLYEVSCDELDWLVDYVRNHSSVIGARMMGGGFGGCTINIVKENEIDSLIENIKPEYEKVMNLPLTVHIATIENGTEKI